MDTFLYIIIFVIGSLFGSFFTLAVYRIPKKQDIIYTSSYCPNCQHKLGFWELIPIVSYMALKGKCVHCGQKIRIRYLILEILSGITFVLLALSINISVFNLDKIKIAYFLFYVLYIVTLFIISGIDHEKKVIEKSVLLFGILISICFMIYVCIAKQAVIYTYIILMVGIALLLILDIVFLKSKFTENYAINILLLSLIMVNFSGVEVFYYTIILCLFIIGIRLTIININNRLKSKSVTKAISEKCQLPIGYYLAISNICLMIFSNFLQ